MHSMPQRQHADALRVGGGVAVAVGAHLCDGGEGDADVKGEAKAGSDGECDAEAAEQRERGAREDGVPQEEDDTDKEADDDDGDGDEDGVPGNGLGDCGVHGVGQQEVKVGGGEHRASALPVRPEHVLHGVVPVVDDAVVQVRGDAAGLQGAG